MDYDAGGIAKLQQKIKKSLKYQPQEKQQRRQTSMKENIMYCEKRTKNDIWEMLKLKKTKAGQRVSKTQKIVT